MAALRRSLLVVLLLAFASAASADTRVALLVANARQPARRFATLVAYPKGEAASIDSGAPWMSSGAARVHQCRLTGWRRPAAH